MFGIYFKVLIYSHKKMPLNISGAWNLQNIKTATINELWDHFGKVYMKISSSLLAYTFTVEAHQL